jgi:hypothetical protein
MPRRCAALSTADQAGEYQIGEVKARSWWIIVTFLGSVSL